MNEKLQYAEMLEIPVSTCNITYKPPKKKRFSLKKKVNADEIKAEVIEKVNSAPEADEPIALERPVLEEPAQNALQEQERVEKEESSSLTVSIKKADKKKFKFKKIGVIGVQVAVICALVATIFLTNALFEGSGINTFFKGVFGAESVEQVDEREFSEFAPVISVGDSALTVTDGVITSGYTGSCYSPCDGKVSSISVGEGGKFMVEISHSKNFKTVISGLTYVYAEQGGEVFSNVPVGYLEDAGATISFYDGEDVIKNFTVDGNKVVWAV